MSRKYIDDLGVKFEDTPQGYNTDSKKETRWGKWEEERQTYGFDERETWCLDLNLALWMYERLMMYLEIAWIDLEYHTFEYNGETLTERQCIDKMLEGFKLLILDHGVVIDEEKSAKVDDAFKILGICHHALWW